ncbi:MAG TPA: hypothetical protein PLX68_02440 [Dermatophilaceae bacterium]|nr:hypothetical protein [Dermatophilaceae bacterium]
MFALSGPVSALTLSASGNVSIIEGLIGDEPHFLYARGHRSLG